MSIMYISLICISMTAYLINKIFGFRDYISVSLSFFLFLIIQIVLIGFLISWLNKLANTNLWTMYSITLLALISLYYYTAIPRSERSHKLQINKKILDIYSSLTIWLREESTHFQKIVLLILLPVFTFITITNLIIIFNVAPHNWDSMTYHLARIPYFLQQNSLAHFGADYWAQDVHPKNATLLNIYIYSNRSFGKPHAVSAIFCIYY